MPDDRTDSENRPSPDALLEHAEREGRGRLRIFLGAAPGVGKTYEMLMAGRARRADGVDVVIGVVETHGRKETQALVDGYEVIPRRLVDYRGQTLDEMDIDAILKRRPALVLVDELAHTNAPGSRHPKRYLDVQEILAQGIDVYTTLNIQHVESLNDVVAQITRVRVRETVPDSIIDEADDIEIIDLTPDDLIKRLQDGKVYFPNTAQRAIENYFSPGNLTALRELALRRTAQRVDEQLLNHMQSHAIPGPWAAGERVLVCVDSQPGGAARTRFQSSMLNSASSSMSIRCCAVGSPLLRQAPICCSPKALSRSLSIGARQTSSLGPSSSRSPSRISTPVRASNRAGPSAMYPSWAIAGAGVKGTGEAAGATTSPWAQAIS